jgi:hypothetical protein
MQPSDSPDAPDSAEASECNERHADEQTDELSPGSGLVRDDDPVEPNEPG